MITIKHHPNGGMTCKDTSHKYGHACGYCMGCIKPRYPVPAIPTRHVWRELSFGVCLLYQHKGRKGRHWFTKEIVDCV